MDKRNKIIKIISITLVCIMVLLQITALILFDGKQLDDAGWYQDKAITIADDNSFYPDENNEFNFYMANPGYINYLSLFYRLSDNDFFPLLSNIILSLLLGLTIFYITKKLFKRSVISWLALLIFSIFPMYIAEGLYLRTELPFTLLAFLAIASILSNYKGKFIYAGIFLAFANWIRPLGLVFLLVILITMLVNKEKIKSYIAFLIPIVCLLLIFGFATYQSSGYFAYQSATGGVNLLMGANDIADGSFSWDAYQPGQLGYNENYDTMNFMEKDEYLMSTALSWVKENPWEYISLVPSKLFYMYSTDTYSFSTFYNNEILTSGREYIEPLVKNVLTLKFSNLTWVDYIVIYNQGIYMLLLVLYIASIIVILKEKKYHSLIILFGILFLGTGMTIVTVGGARYHYPFIPVMIIGTAYVIDYWLLKKKGKDETVI